MALKICACYHLNMSTHPTAPRPGRGYRGACPPAVALIDHCLQILARPSDIADIYRDDLIEVLSELLGMLTGADHDGVQPSRSEATPVAPRVLTRA